MVKRRRADGEGTIYQRHDGTWAGAIDLGWVDGKRERKFVYGKTQADVVDKLATLRLTLHKGQPLTDGRLTLQQYLEDWMLNTLPGTVRPSTEASYADLTRRHIIPKLGRFRLEKLTPAQVRSFLRDKSKLEGARGRPLSPRTVQYIHAVLRLALEQARHDEIVARNVAALVKAPQVRRAEVVPYSAEQARVLLQALRGDRLEALYTLAVGIGLRRGELLGLTWQAVDLEGESLRVRHSLQRVNGQLALVEPKTARSRRTLPLPGLCVRALRQQQERQRSEPGGFDRWGDEWGLVFTTSVGTPIEPRNLNRHFTTVTKRAGLPKLRFHDLRHTCASLLLAEGVEPRVIMEILGHSVIGTTMNLYAHVMPVTQRAAAASMDGLLQPRDGSTDAGGSTSGSKEPDAGPASAPHAV